jgi:hypothetical protein
MANTHARGLGRTHIFGIRHHGPGSARSLCTALNALAPDCVLVEGPPEANGILQLAAREEMVPPVALLIYAPEEPRKAVYYPFAVFSPEWQAIQYALENQVVVRFMDLPQSAQMAAMAESIQRTQDQEVVDAPNIASSESGPLPADPLTWVAGSAGYSDGERWWEHLVEKRRDSRDLFAGILELMAALREEAGQAAFPAGRLEIPREAHMRAAIRSALQEGYQNIAVVCGAWHVPVLACFDAFEDDAAILEKLPHIETSATWVPWTYDRLSFYSGYGAGVLSPGWYEHIWQHQGPLVEGWMVNVARHLRAEDLNVSPAHIIEAVRLADTLAAMRETPLPGLLELNESVLAVFCGGDETPMQLIEKKLIVGVRLGKVPTETPMVPLQRDLNAAQKRTRLEPTASPEIMDLDLRKPLLLERSQLLHRLNILDIPWGKLQTARGAKGTFHEIWQVAWQPEFIVAIIEASLWGNTVLEAATQKLQARAKETEHLPALTGLIEAALLADLPDAIAGLIERVQHESAASGDLAHIMEAFLPLANVLRYGNVRQTDTGMVRQVVDEMAARICIGIPSACLALDDDAAQAMFERLGTVNQAMLLLDDANHAQAWARTLNILAAHEEVHGLVRGRACRYLFDRPDTSLDIAQTMSLALSPGQPPAAAAAWAQGFFHRSGIALIHNPSLWQIMDRWVMSLSPDTFITLLPVMRRTFSAFPAPERRQISELARSGGENWSGDTQNQWDSERGMKVLPLLVKIFGLEGAKHE